MNTKHTIRTRTQHTPYLWKRTAIPSPTSNPELLHFFLEPLVRRSTALMSVNCTRTRTQLVTIERGFCHFTVRQAGRRAHITSSTDHPPIFETMMTTDDPFFFPWWRDISLQYNAQGIFKPRSRWVREFEPHKDVSQITSTPRRRIIVVLVLLLLVVVVVAVVFTKSLRSYYFQLYLWKRPKPDKVASHGNTISFSR